MEPRITKPLADPALLTANLHNHAPAKTSEARTKNEQRVQKEVGDYFAALGMSVLQTGDMVTGETKSSSGQPVMLVSFFYSETYQNVHKFFEVKRRVKGEWRPSNIRFLRAYAALRETAYEAFISGAGKHDPELPPEEYL